jgi:hypothetical protein
MTSPENTTKPAGVPVEESSAHGTHPGRGAEATALDQEPRHGG